MKITLYEGNTRKIPCTLRRKGVITPADVSDATSIIVEYESEGGEKFTPIECDSGAAGADWVNGVVVIDTSAVAAQPYGTYKWCMTVELGGSEITWDGGDFEVVHRPGYPHPA